MSDNHGNADDIAPKPTLSGGQTITPAGSAGMPASGTLSGGQTMTPAGTPVRSPVPRTMSGDQTLTPGTPGWTPDSGRTAGAFVQLSVGTLVANRFEVVAELGQGGMGQVFRVRDTKLGVDRAMKIIAPHLVDRPDVLERFRNEVITSQKLAHPNIVRVYEYDEDTDRNLHFFTMELFEGLTLRAWLNHRRQAGKQVSLEEFQRIAGALCEALAYAHDVTVHRDLKPENVMVSEDLGIIKLTDFGIAKALQSDRAYVTAGAMGTPYYMAPEQESQELGVKIDHRADIYSLGVMFYELLTGRLPRGNYKPINQYRRDVPCLLDQVIGKAMAEAQEERWDSAEKLRWSLLHPDTAEAGGAEERSGHGAITVEQRTLSFLAEWFKQRQGKAATIQEIRKLHADLKAHGHELISRIEPSLLLRLADLARRKAADELLWDEVCRENTEAGYERYLQTEGLGAYRESASQKLMELIDARETSEQDDDRFWGQTQTLNTVEAYEKYLSTSHLLRHMDSAELCIHELQFDRATTNAERIVHLKALSDAHLNNDAYTTKLTLLEQEERIYAASQPIKEDLGDPNKLLDRIRHAVSYLDTYPHGEHAPTVRSSWEALLSPVVFFSRKLLDHHRFAECNRLIIAGLLLARIIEQDSTGRLHLLEDTLKRIDKESKEIESRARAWASVVKNNRGWLSEVLKSKLRAINSCFHNDNNIIFLYNHSKAVIRNWVVLTLALPVILIVIIILCDIHDLSPFIIFGCPLFLLVNMSLVALWMMEWPGLLGLPGFVVPSLLSPSAVNLSLTANPSVLFLEARIHFVCCQIDKVAIKKKSLSKNNLATYYEKKRLVLFHTKLEEERKSLNDIIVKAYNDPPCILGT